MGLLARRALLLVAVFLATSCAGYRGGWESVAYLGNTPPAVKADSMSSESLPDPPELNIPGLKLRVTIDNRLRTYDTQVYFFALPLSVDPRNVYSKNVETGKTRVFVTVTPLVPGFVFYPTFAVLHVADKHFIGAAGFEFGQWNDQWKRVERDGRWEHRPIERGYALSEVGRRYYLSIDFVTPVPSPETPDIVLDLSQALKSPTEPPLPLIRFAPVRWKEGYT